MGKVGKLLAHIVKNRRADLSGSIIACKYLIRTFSFFITLWALSSSVLASFFVITSPHNGNVRFMSLLLLEAQRKEHLGWTDLGHMPILKSLMWSWERDPDWLAWAVFPPLRWMGKGHVTGSLILEESDSFWKNSG